MEIFSALLAIWRGINRSPVVSPQIQVTRSFDVSFDLRLHKRLANNREAGHLRRHRAHYEAIVMMNICSRLYNIGWFCQLELRFCGSKIKASNTSSAYDWIILIQ